MKDGKIGMVSKTEWEDEYFVRISRVRKQLGRPRRKWEVNIKTNIT
jgi:hypothetical protein